MANYINVRGAGVFDGITDEDRKRWNQRKEKASAERDPRSSNADYINKYTGGDPGNPYGRRSAIPVYNPAIEQDMPQIPKPTARPGWEQPIPAAGPAAGPIKSDRDYVDRTKAALQRQADSTEGTREAWARQMVNQAVEQQDRMKAAAPPQGYINRQRAPMSPYDQAVALSTTGNSFMAKAMAPLLQAEAAKYGDDARREVGMRNAATQEGTLALNQEMEPRKLAAVEQDNLLKYTNIAQRQQIADAAAQRAENQARLAHYSAFTTDPTGAHITDPTKQFKNLDAARRVYGAAGYDAPTAKNFYTEFMQNQGEDVEGRANGGLVGYADGGMVDEEQVPVTAIPEEGTMAAMESGDYIIPTEAVRFYGTKFFNDLIEKAETAE